MNSAFIKPRCALLCNEELPANPSFQGNDKHILSARNSAGADRGREGSRPPPHRGRRRREAAPAEQGLAECTHLGLGVQGDDFLVVVQQFAGVRNVNGRFLFVTGEDPNLQARLTQFGDGFRDSVLQAVFNPRGTWSNE